MEIDRVDGVFYFSNSKIVGVREERNGVRFVDKFKLVWKWDNL